MNTQLMSAKNGIITQEMKNISKQEKLPEIEILSLVADGRVVIPYNPGHSPKKPFCVGRGTRTKINVNLGMSPKRENRALELEKLKLAEELGADAVMDLTISGDITAFRKEILAHSTLPVGTVPVYEAFELAKRRGGDFSSVRVDDILDTIKRQAGDGVDFMTVHAGLNRRSLERLERDKRTLGIVSRGGSLTAYWMKKNNAENPVFEHFDRILDIASEYDVTLSLGDALRPGCINDASDRGQIEELVTLGELADQARERGVQVMIEGPGHIPLDQIEANMKIQQSLCKGAPFYVLGPVVCDTAPGYDHITSAIGGSLAALHGASFLCYVTPAEHLRLPTLQDVREGIIAAKIAAFSADLALGKAYAVGQNDRIAKARKKLDWESQFCAALDPSTARSLHESEPTAGDRETCTMCGDFCAVRLNLW